MVGAISHIGQGHKAAIRGDMLSAHAFYKKAQQLLIQSPHPEPRRRRMIKELGEILSNKRKSLSLDLMPEDFYNPEQTLSRESPGDAILQAQANKQEPPTDTQINL